MALFERTRHHVRLTAAGKLFLSDAQEILSRVDRAVRRAARAAAGVFGYFGPQTLGALRDWTGGFAAGFYAVAVADLLTLALILTLYRRAWNRQYGTPAVPRSSVSP